MKYCRDQFECFEIKCHTVSLFHFPLYFADTIPELVFILRPVFQYRQKKFNAPGVLVSPFQANALMHAPLKIRELTDVEMAAPVSFVQTDMGFQCERNMNNMRMIFKLNLVKNTTGIAITMP